MKNRINFPLLKTLLGKQWKESLSGFGGRNKKFDLAGFLLKAVLTVSFVAVFVVFFSQFAELYLAIRIDGIADAGRRQLELLTMAYSVIFLALVIHGTGSINRAVFGGEDLKIFSALPIDANTLYLSKALTIYVRQVLVSAFTVLPVNLTFAIQTSQSPVYYVMTAFLCVLFPLIAIAVSSLLALPVHSVKRFLRHKFVLSFLLVTVLAAAGFLLYSQILEAVKKMLLGDELKYFFDENVMNAIRSFTDACYPARWLADILLWKNTLVAGIGLAGVLAVCLAVSVFVIRKLLIRSMQQRISGDQRYIMLKKPSIGKRSATSALVRKEFTSVFRTPGYVFGYFSVAVLMPMMVYFCMTIGVSLVHSLIFVDCSLEIAVFLTILFGVLTNTFCATNVSRDGGMFLAVKAMPVSGKQVFFSKVLFCFLVTAASNLISAGLLVATGHLALTGGLFVLGVGLLLGFAQICFATRKDFNHPRFSTEEDGEIKESNNTVSTIIVAGLVVAALVGGILLYYKMKTGLFGGGSALVTWLVVGGISIAAAALAYVYLIRKLNRKYYEFSEGL